MIKAWIKKQFAKHNLEENRENETMAKIREILSYTEKYDLYPDIKIINSAVEPMVLIEGKNYLMFTSNNYLGLSTHPRIKEAAIQAIEKYGTGSTGSRLLSGNIDIHIELEQKLAQFKKGEDAIVFPTGFSTNIGVISAITKPLNILPLFGFKKKSIILSDELNHASIIDGCKQSNQKVISYRHLDTKHLESLLKKYKYKMKIIITDSIFSMDGDIAPLDEISKLAKKYDALIMIDEAHSTGTLGKNGVGATEYFNLKIPEDIAVVMGTLSKALGSCGGYIVGSRNLIKYLRIAARSYMFSTAMPPSASASAIASINLIQSDQSLLEKLESNIKYLKEGLEKMGFNTMKSRSAIIPILIGKDEDAIKTSRMFFEKGIFAPCVRWPAVPRNKSRIRFTITASHSQEQINKLLSVSCEIGKTLKLIR